MSASIVGSILTRLFCLGIGLVCLLPSAYKLAAYGMFRYRAVAVRGVIEHPSAGRDLGGRPLIAYTDHQGLTHEFKSRAKTHWFTAPRKGERIKVFYLAHDPQSAVVGSLFHHILFPLMLSGVGGYCCYCVLKDVWIAVIQRQMAGRG